MISVRTILSELTDLDVEAPPPPPPAPRDATLATAVRRHIEAVLRECHGNQVRAAARLGIVRSTLTKYLTRWRAADARDGVRCVHCAAKAEWVARPHDQGYYRCPACRVGFLA
jgi:hypothetical protein